MRVAIYHTRVKTFSRAKGHSSTAAAAYRAGIAIEDQRTGQKHDYLRRGGVVETRCVAPDDAPDWACQPWLLWPAAELSERRINSTVAREFEIALPHELNDDQRSALTAEIARHLVDRYQFAVQASIHEPGTPDGLNWHAHILATTRRVDAHGLAEKTRELDGGPSGRGEVEWIRAMVSEVTNGHLRDAGFDTRVDHRSLDEQAEAALDADDPVAAIALNRRPTQHIGKNATALHRKGVECQRHEVNRHINQSNDTSFEAAMSGLGEPARVMPTPASHSHARARQDRARENDFLPEALWLKSGDNHIQIDPVLIGRPAPPAEPNPDDAKAAATRAVLTEATQLWGEGFFSTIAMTFQATTKLLRHQVDRLAAYVQSALFRSDVRSFLDQVKQLKRDALRFKRRMKAEDRAQHELAQAEFLLERFDSEHPRPGLLSRPEWSRRRARRLRAVQVRQESFRKAHEATGPAAQDAYNAAALASAVRLEAWSASMLARFPVDADKDPVPEAAPTAVVPDPPLKKHDYNPRGHKPK